MNLSDGVDEGSFDIEWARQCGDPFAPVPVSFDECACQFARARDELVRVVMEDMIEPWAIPVLDWMARWLGDE